MLKAKKVSPHELSTCKVCKRFYLNPVILPCGESVCNEHVKSSFACDIDSNNTYDCVLCEENHLIPEGGFIFNKHVIDFLSMNFHLNDEAKEVQEAIDEFDELVKEMRLFCKDPAKIVADYFSTARFKINSKKEKWIEIVRKCVKTS